MNLKKHFYRKIFKNKENYLKNKINKQMLNLEFLKK